MTTTATPEPPEEEPSPEKVARLIAGWSPDPGAISGLKAALEKSTHQLPKNLSPAMRRLVDAGKLTRVEPAQVRKLDPEHPPKGETAQDVLDRILEYSARQLDATTEGNAILEKQVEDATGQATESEKHAKTSKRVAVASFAVALFALFGALPQGIAALPDTWEVITNVWTTITGR